MIRMRGGDDEGARIVPSMDNVDKAGDDDSAGAVAVEGPGTRVAGEGGVGGRRPAMGEDGSGLDGHGTGEDESLVARPTTS